MGLGRLLHRLWRFFHPQWTAMSQKQIADIDRAVAEDMAKGSFTTREHRSTAAAPASRTADQLWLEDTANDAAISVGGEAGERSSSLYGSVYGGGGETASVYSSPPYYCPTPNPNDRLWSMGSHRAGGGGGGGGFGRANSIGSSSRGRDSGYAEYFSPSSSLSSPAAMRRPYSHSYISGNCYKQQQEYPLYEQDQLGGYHAESYQDHRYSYYSEQQQQQQQQQHYRGSLSPRYRSPSRSPYPNGNDGRYPSLVSGGEYGHQLQQQQQQQQSGGRMVKGGGGNASPPPQQPSKINVWSYGPPVDEDDDIVPGRPVNAPF
ncbi:unnamed protein product [Discula destructiva]